MGGSDEKNLWRSTKNNNTSGWFYPRQCIPKGLQKPNYTADVNTIIIDSRIGTKSSYKCIQLQAIKDENSTINVEMCLIVDGMFLFNLFKYR